MRKKRIATAAFLALSAFSLLFWTPNRAGAQVVPPNRNAIDVSVALFPGAPVYSVGLDYVLSRQFDLTLAYSFQTVAGATGSLLDAGIRYHFPVPAPGVDIFLGGGLASASATLPGLGTANNSGLSVGGGVSVQLAKSVTGYASGSVVSLSGGSNSIIDLGLLVQLAPLVGVQLGYLSFAGNGATYLGLNVAFPTIP